MTKKKAVKKGEASGEVSPPVDGPGGENIPVEAGHTSVHEGTIDEIRLYLGDEVLMTCPLQSYVDGVAMCAHPRKHLPTDICTDLRLARGCPLTECAVLLSAGYQDQVVHEEELVSVPESKLMHCGRCGCNLQITKEDMAQSEKVLCPSCGHVHKNRTGKK